MRQHYAFWISCCSRLKNKFETNDHQYSSFISRISETIFTARKTESGFFPAIWDHSCSIYATIFEKLTFLTPDTHTYAYHAHIRITHTHTCAHQGVTNISFSENFAYLLNEWPLSGIARRLGKEDWSQAFSFI